MTVLRYPSAFIPPLTEWAFPRYFGKTCSHCGGYFGELKLGQDEWVCPHCGKVISRDKNAGINIKREGIRQFYAGLSGGTSTTA